MRRAAAGFLVCVAGCASPPPTQPVAPASIDLAPRCLEIAGAPPLAAPPATAAPAAAGAIAPWDAPEGIRGFALSTPRSAFESLAWGFRAPEPRDAFALELAAALLRGGHTAAEPEDFRVRRNALGGEAAVHVENGWLWLELLHLPQEREAAAQLLAEWAQPHPVDPDVFASTRRSVALARMAEDASAERAAARAFERLYQKPPGAADGVPGGGSMREEWSADRADAFVRRLLQQEGSVRLRSRSSPLAAESPASGEGVATGASGPIGASDTGVTAAERGPALEPEPGALYLVARAGAPQVEILVGHATVGPAAVDASALEMLASLLGGDVGGRLFRDLRERQGLAYIVNAFQQPQGRFVVTTRARADRVPALIVGIEAHLRALSEVPLLDCEVRDLQQRMSGEEALRADDAEALRARVRAEISWGLRPLSYAERASAYAGVDRDALETVARHHLGGQPIVVLVGDETALREALAIGLPERPLRVFDAELERAE